MPKIVEKKVRSRSDCWYFFTKTENGGICKFCSKLVRSTGNTTNLLNHARRIHREQWDEREIHHRDESDNRSESPEAEQYMAVAYVNIDENQERALRETSQTIKLIAEERHNGENSEHKSHSMETFHTVQGDTVIWLQPSVSREHVDDENRTFHPQITVVTHAADPDGETILPNGEVVAKAGDDRNQVQNNCSASLEERKPDERTLYQRQMRVFNKNMRVPSVSKPDRNERTPTASPVKIVRPAGITQSENSAGKADIFDNFGRYIGSLLRDLPSRRSACRLQKEIIWLVLQEQMQLEDT